MAIFCSTSRRMSPTAGPTEGSSSRTIIRTQFPCISRIALSPRDPNIHVTAQDRNYDQSFYRLDYTQAGVRSPRRPPVLGQFSADGLPSTRVFAPFAVRHRRRRSRLQEVGCVARETARSDQSELLSSKLRKQPSPGSRLTESPCSTPDARVLQERGWRVKTPISHI